MGKKSIWEHGLLEQQAHRLGLKVVREQEKWVWSPAAQRGFLLGPTLSGTCVWVIPSFLKSLEKWKERGMHWKERKAYRLCLGFHGACGGNLPAQCLALHGTSAASFQKPETPSWSVFSELRPIPGMQRDELAALNPQWTLVELTPQPWVPYPC